MSYFLQKKLFGAVKTAARHRKQRGGWTGLPVHGFTITENKKI